MLLIKNGRVIDPANGIDDVRDIIIEQGTILEVRREGPGREKETGRQVIDHGGT